MTRSLQHEASPARGAKPDRPSPGAGMPIRSAPAMLRRAPGCACGGVCPRCQARSGLRIGDASDPAEREADAMAERVLALPASLGVTPGPGAMLQRKCATCEREGEDEDVFHLARRGFRLNGRPHELLLLRQLTSELRRQEVQTWKKVIRVISHELNNSLAPVASLAHSGAELTRRGQTEKLEAIFGMIEERARHLEGFIRGYARFAKLPAPRTEPVDWPRFVAQLRDQVVFAVDGPVPAGSVRVDAAQFEQALLNLIKNAHESGSPAGEVQVAIRRLPEDWRIDVLDRGQGMNEAVLSNALLPFYSTKRNGTGLGLALTREIVVERQRIDDRLRVVLPRDALHQGQPAGQGHGVVRAVHELLRQRQRLDGRIVARDRSGQRRREGVHG